MPSSSMFDVHVFPVVGLDTIWASSTVASHSHFFMMFSHLIFSSTTLHIFLGLPGGLVPSISKFSACLRMFSSLLSSPNHLNAVLLSNSSRASMLLLLTTSLFEIPSCHLIAIKYLTILTSHCNNSASSCFIMSQVCALYRSTGLTHGLYTFALLPSKIFFFTNELASSLQLFQAQAVFPLSAASASHSHHMTSSR